jgi:uncharacterized protein with FMN-binding domain
VPVPTPRHASLARRALPALTLAGAGGLLLIELDHPSSPTTPVAAPAFGTTSAAGASSTPPGATTPATPNPAAAGGQGTVPATVPGAIPSTVPAAPQACGKDEVGPAVQTRWGPVQVEALVSTDGTVCDVQALQSPGGARRSIAINAEALPILHDRAVQSGAAFDAVSGATITSEGYRSSLQAILDGA